jgi:CheY-like chemotaxis protein
VALTVLVADADAASLQAIKQRLIERGYLIRTARDGQEALDRLRRAPVDLIIATVTLPVIDGPALVEGLRRGGDETPVVLIGQATTAPRQLFGVRFLRAPFELYELLDAVHKTIRERSSR